jgi:4-hydroxy-3-polyprenylbenzoate decarboxylase
MIDDLRDFLFACERHSLLHRVKTEVDWNLELSHLATLNENQAGPALLFERVKGHSGIPVLTSAFTTSQRMALCLEQDPKLSLVQLSRWWMDRLSSGVIPPQIVDNVPVSQNVLVGDSVDLMRFPAPRFYPEDGGRYLGTAHYLICKDPDTGWTNLGTYRMQLQDRNSVSVMIARGKDAELIYRKYAQRNERMPVAVVIGSDPLHFLVSSTYVGPGVNEYDIIGALRQRPVQVFQSDLTGLLLPAKAEIILEGHLHLDDLRPEGPLGEFTGYYSSAKDITGSSVAPTIRVQRILHRENPIFWASTVGKPINDCHMIQSINRSAMLWHELETRKIPGIKSVYVFPETCGWFWAAISLRQLYPGHANQVGLTAIAHYGLKGVILVDDDIPVDDWNALWWALSVRFDPRRSIQIIDRGRASALDPSLPVENRSHMSKVILDACTPFEWNEKPREVRMDPVVVQRILDRWKEYGLPGQPPAPADQ